MIWVGQFDSELDFEEYMDQSAFYKWWKEYDEDNEELRCQFCKELGVMSYDEDFLIMKYASNGINELLNLIPAQTSKIREAIENVGMSQCNAVVCYNCSCGISPRKAKNAVSIKYLGSYKFEQDIEGVANSLAGLEYMIWIGTTEKSREEFMEYFNQDTYVREMEAYNACFTKKRPNPEYRCQFCKDIGIKFYYPEFLKVTILDSLEDPFKMVRKIIDNKLVPDWSIEVDIKKYNIKPANCIVCYIPNGFKDKKKDQKIFIKKKDYEPYETPKKYVEELISYNGIRYLETYIAE